MAIDGRGKILRYIAGFHSLEYFSGQVPVDGETVVCELEVKEFTILDFIRLIIWII